MSNEQRPNYKDLEPTYKITGQDQDYTYIQKETRYTYGTNPNLNSHNLISLGLMFNAMCPKKYRNIDAAAIFLDKNNEMVVYKCWVDDARTGEPFIIPIYLPALGKQLYYAINHPHNITDDEKIEIFDIIKKMYKVNKCIVCNTECNKKCLCGMVYYCCEEHQRQDRKNHKRICQASKV